MYLNLFHNGKKYIFETGNKLNIGHLKEISENILKSNKNILQIIYDNPSTYHKYINPNDKTFLRDLIPKGQNRAKFSIKLGSANSATNLKSIPFICKEQKSENLNKGIDDISKKFFGNFSYMQSAQKKFNTMISYKFNELLMEIRELIRRINEVYDEIYKAFSKSTANYNEDMTRNNKNDLNNKMKQIIDYELQMIKFIEKEKNFYSKLNSIFKECLVEQNGKIIISNKIMKELYKNMFTESNKNVKFDFNEKDFTSNIIDNPFKNFDKNNLQKNNNNLSLESELFRDKFSKAKTKRTLRNLSSLNIGSNTNDNFSYANFNKNDNTNNSNMNFNTNETKDNNTNINNNFNSNINKNNIYSNNIQNNNIHNNNTVNNNTHNNNIHNNNTINNNTHNNNIHNNNFPRLKANKLMNMNQINRSESKLMISTEVGPDGVQRGKILLFSNEKKTNNNNLKENNKTKEEKGIGENDNNNLNSIKNRMSFRNSKMLNFSHFKTKEDLKQNINSEGMDDKNKNNDNKKNIELKNNGTNMDKETDKNNKENKDKKDIDNNNKKSGDPSLASGSDSTDFINKNKNKINNNSNENNKNEEENKNSKDNKDNIDPNNNNKEKKNEESKLNNNIILNLDDIKIPKKPRKPKKVRKKRKNSSEDNSESSKSDDVSEKGKEKKKKKKKSHNNNSINEDSKESEKSKKSKEDLFDLHLLRNISLDKDNPYKKNNAFQPYSKKIKENELIRPEIPESDESEEEKKRLALFKKKKKNNIKNKYDFLI